ncbi:MAG: hypothetical protein IJA36_01220 [Lachnospiraceae bacterium]|nr:hypothetical protein [Lachnospiraceae bacterium]
MKKEWLNPEMAALEIKETANGQYKSEDHDGDWVQFNGLWYRPGAGEEFSE